MAIIKCKMCGKFIEFDEKQNNIVCNHCGSVQTNKGKNSKKTIFVIAIICLHLITILIFFKVISPNLKYNDAINYMSAKQYEEAINLFQQIEDYKDSRLKIKESVIANASLYESKGDSVNAIKWYEIAGDAEKTNDVRYNYITAHKNTSDELTYKYLLELIKINYKDAKSIYLNLYSFKANLIFNTDSNDTTTNLNSIDYYDNSAVCHMFVTGSTPNGKTNVTVLTEFYTNYDELIVSKFHDNDKTNKEIKLGEHSGNNVIYMEHSANVYYQRVTVYDTATGQQLAQEIIHTPSNNR